MTELNAQPDASPIEDLRDAVKALSDPACGLSQARAEVLAAWLKTCANDLADARHYVDEPNSCHYALAFARTILGRTA